MELLLKLFAVFVLGYAAQWLIVNTVFSGRYGFDGRRIATLKDSFSTEVSLGDGIVIVITAIIALYFAVTNHSFMWGVFAAGMLAGPAISIIRRFVG